MDEKSAAAVPLEEVLEAERKDIKIIRERRRVNDDSSWYGVPRPPANLADSPIPSKASASTLKAPWAGENPKWDNAVNKPTPRITSASHFPAAASAAPRSISASFKGSPI